MAEVKAWQTAIGIIATVLATNGGQFALGKDTRQTANESYAMGKACREMLEASRARETSLFNELRECIRECSHVSSDHVAENLSNEDMLISDLSNGPLLVSESELQSSNWERMFLSLENHE